MSDGWMPVGRRRRVFRLRHGADVSSATLIYGNGAAVLSIEGREVAFGYGASGDELDVTLGGIRSRIVALRDGADIYLRTPNGRFELHHVDPFGGEDDEQGGDDRIVAPLPGTVVAVLAAIGAKLEKGAPILTLEVMKMEQTLRAPFAGTLKSLRCKVGDIVGEGVELAEVEPAS
jgi:3-methylcrotonyl-CoA carboxylase alpha subunit